MAPLRFTLTSPLSGKLPNEYFITTNVAAARTEIFSSSLTILAWWCTHARTDTLIANRRDFLQLHESFEAYSLDVFLFLCFFPLYFFLWFCFLFFITCTWFSVLVCQIGSFDTFFFFNCRLFQLFRELKRLLNFSRYCLKCFSIYRK